MQAFTFAPISAPEHCVASSCPEMPSGVNVPPLMVALEIARPGSLAPASRFLSGLWSSAPFRRRVQETIRKRLRVKESPNLENSGVPGSLFLSGWSWPSLCRQQ
jgi:hypothetical protein